jgi:GDP-mannose 6-dehydrogenase
MLVALYEKMDAPLVRTDVETAEMVKYTDNAWHAVKVAFANEIGNLSKAVGIDGHKVMEIFCKDTKLNLSPYYLKPGFAFGGSCLPKDLRGLVYAARRADVSLPLLSHVLPSNEEHLRRAFDLVAATGKRRIGLFGLSFKPGTDDLRESPLVELAERLLGKGYDLRIYDDNVAVSRLMGANREFIESRLPHLGDLLADSVDDVVAHADVMVVGCKDPAVLAALDAAGDRTIIDLVRLPDAHMRRTNPRYFGLGW